MPLGTLILAGIFIVAAGLRLAQIWQDWQLNRAWQPTMGRVTRSELVRVSPRDEPDTIALYEPNIIYTYLIDGKSYRGEVTDEDIGLIKKARGERLLEDYAQDQDVTVYYWPSEPWQSTLFPRKFDRRQVFYAGVGLMAGCLILLLNLSGL